MRAERVLILTHGAAEVTEGVMPTLLSIIDTEGVQAVATAEEVAKHPVLARHPVIGVDDLRPGGVDLVMVLGGDGSMLRALSRAAATGAPVIGINYGRVGFLATIEQSDLESGVRRAIAGNYVTLGLPSLRADWSDGTIQAVNDLAFLRGGESRLADLSYSVSGEPVATVRCDGLICSTPVGSTAYNLAAGGPTVSWKVKCFVVSFIAAHHLDTRPLVIAPEETMVVTNSAIVGDCDLLADGVRIAQLPPGRSITVSLSGNQVHLAIFPESSFFRRYREKFGRS
ncbi:MAG: NAD(+)/NADH kinase [Thermoleophilia bacterium]|nr:NAD(+)/NADH kinase [Thermoleophilia bacterium]